MLKRSEVLAAIVDSLHPQHCAVSALGNTSRDLFALSAEKRAQCFYCMGSMGSVVPFALGLSIARPALRVTAIEGDGSLLMNLGALSTLKRYGSASLRVVVLDNGCYESTGGQPSQPKDLRIEEVCRAFGLAVEVAATGEELGRALTAVPVGPSIVVAKAARERPSARIDEPPARIGLRFTEWVRAS